MSHEHSHDDHAPQTDDNEGPPGEYEILSRAMQELLEEKGLIKAEQIQKKIEQFDEEYKNLGAKVEARAWTHTEFKDRLM